jgi:hypothetical protein
MACDCKVSWRFIDSGSVEGTGKCEGNCTDPKGPCRGRWLLANSTNIEMSASVDDEVVLFSATANPATADAVFECLCGDHVECQITRPLKLKYTRPLVLEIGALGILALKDLLSK